MPVPEDKNSEVFASLKHTIRRRILRILSVEPRTFSDIQKEFGIASSHLSYHLDGLGNLVHRCQDGKYELSSAGKVAFSMIKEVGENRIAFAKRSVTAKKSQSEGSKRHFRIGTYSVPAWVVVLLMVSVIGSSVLGYYLYSSFMVPLEVKEPIEILDYPSQWSLYPGETAHFNVAVKNSAPLNYSVVLDFEVSDAAYQTRYVSFSNEIYTVVPGQQNLEAWINVGIDAPATNTTVTVRVSRSTNGTTRWWSIDWQYRKSHVVHSGTGAGTNYQVKIVVVNGSGTDSGDTVFIDNKSRSDFGDVRFVANDGITRLDYWMEGCFEGKNATFWVEVSDDLSVSDVTIWMYYGNPVATSLSDGSGTFIVFDDFEGDSIDTSKWTIVGTVQTSNEYAFTRSRCMKHDIGISYIELKTIPATANIRICAWIRDILSSRTPESVLEINGFASESSICSGVSEDVDPDYYVYRYQSTYFGSNILRTPTFHKVEIEVTDNAYFRIDDVLQPGYATCQGVYKIRLGSLWDSATEYEYWDTFYIRKCVRTEPTHGSWGLESTY